MRPESIWKGGDCYGSQAAGAAFTPGAAEGRVPAGCSPPMASSPTRRHPGPQSPGRASPELRNETVLPTQDRCSLWPCRFLPRCSRLVPRRRGGVRGHCLWEPQTYSFLNPFPASCCRQTTILEEEILFPEAAAPGAMESCSPRTAPGPHGCLAGPFRASPRPGHWACLPHCLATPLKPMGKEACLPQKREKRVDN